MVVIWRYSNCQTLSSEVTNEPEPRKDFVKRPTIDICPIIHDGAWPRGRFKGVRCQHILFSCFTCTPHGDPFWLLSPQIIALVGSALLCSTLSSHTKALAQINKQMTFACSRHDGAWPRGRFKGGRVSGEARRQSVGEDDAEDDEESRPGEEEERDDWDASAEQI